jgi:hypothetical protein
MIAGEGLAILAGEFDIYHRRTRTRGRPTSSPGVVSWVSVGALLFAEGSYLRAVRRG